MESFLLAVLLFATCRGVCAYSAASVWGVEPNATYFPQIANTVFESSLANIDAAHRTTGALGLVSRSNIFAAGFL